MYATTDPGGGGQLMTYVPRRIFLTKGVGRHREELHSFELALRDAGIEKCNLVQVSSILPPGCRFISKAKGIKEILPGAITYCVMSRCCSDEPGGLLAWSAGSAARPPRPGTSPNPVS